VDVTLHIRRYDPERDRKAHAETYTVDADPNDQVLDLLNRIKWEQDGSLSYRRSCGHGVCGSDAMRINGVNRLACKVLVREVGTDVTVEPLLGMPVVKDLIVDLTGFFDHYRQVMPYLVNDEPVEDGERLQTREARARYDDTTKCILCAACTTSCPTFWGNDGYLGPAAIVQAHRFLFDDRDRAGAERLQLLSGRLGVWACHTAFNCTRACPRDIQVTRAIGEVKQALTTGRLEQG
jgi:succinate dehydrogenase / fumarate reductase iron-sulfur subunit